MYWWIHVWQKSVPRKCCVKVWLSLWQGICRNGSGSPVLTGDLCWLSSWWISSRQVWSKNNSDGWSYSDNTPIIFSRVFSELLDFCHSKVIEINLLLSSNYFVLMKIYVSGSAHAWLQYLFGSQATLLYWKCLERSTGLMLHSLNWPHFLANLYALE